MSPKVETYFVQEHGQLAYWCPWCKKAHLHGAATGGERGSHCTDERSPLKSYGVYLNVIGEVAKLSDVRSVNRPRSMKPLAQARRHLAEKLH